MAENPEFRISALGDAAAVLSLQARIDPDINARIHGIAAWLSNSDAPITDLVPAYHTLSVFYDPMRIDFAAISALIKSAARQAPYGVTAMRRIELPVCYDPVLAPDLPELAEYCRLTPDEVIALHTGADYRVYFLGFKPGFAYLGGLRARLQMPRKATPRLSVPAGAVGIGGEQTGIYPSASPGGWQIIGRCPIKLFDATRSPPSYLQAGDHARFQAIPYTEYLAMGGTP